MALPGGTRPSADICKSLKPSAGNLMGGYRMASVPGRAKHLSEEFYLLKRFYLLKDLNSVLIP